MTINLNAVLPNLSNGLDNTGFLFGAGSSVEAGYPVMTTLTRNVISELSYGYRNIFDDVLYATEITYDDAVGEPNIEIIADLVMEHAINSGQQRFLDLRTHIEKLVTEAIVSVPKPNLEHHIRFLKLLKARTFGRAACVYIFTTNYDILFELAGAEAEVIIESGFAGSVERFFDPYRFTTTCGTMQPKSRFIEHPTLTVRLIKIHGSVSWFAREGKFYERHPNAIPKENNRIMVLPRRSKVMDTLQPPYDTLFRIMSNSMGTDCKYIASCGFSFSDDHINVNLIQPALSGGKIRLFAFAAAETSGMSAIKALPAFSAGFADFGITAGIQHNIGTDMWKFSKFVGLFT